MIVVDLVHYVSTIHHDHGGTPMGAGRQPRMARIDSRREPMVARTAEGS
jgi:hypothetical protein